MEGKAKIEKDIKMLGIGAAVLGIIIVVQGVLNATDGIASGIGPIYGILLACAGVCFVIYALLVLKALKGANTYVARSIIYLIGIGCDIVMTAMSFGKGIGSVWAPLAFIAIMIFIEQNFKKLKEQGNA